MSSLQDELLTACADGNMERVRDLHQRYSATLAEEGAGALDAMMLRAAEKGHADVVRYLLEQGADISYRVISEATEFPEVFKVLVTVGNLDVNYDLESAGDMLTNAVWEGNSNFTRWLLEHGADPNSGHLLANSASALTCAAQRGSLGLAELLVQHGAKVSGTGALPAAAERSQHEMVRYLLDHGADIDEIGLHDQGDRRKKKDEGTALHQAVANGDVDLAKLLVNRGARTDIRDPLDRTPLMRARERNQQGAIQFLNSIGVTD